MTDDEKIIAKIRNKLVDELFAKIKPEQVIPKADWVKDLGADSLDMIELSMLLEDRFDIDISHEEICRIKTVQDAVNLVKSA